MKENGLRMSVKLEAKLGGPHHSQLTHKILPPLANGRARARTRAS